MEELSLEAEKKTQHLGHGEDNLTVGDIQQELLPHPLSPTVGTPDAGKPTHRIAAVKVLLYNILDDWPKEAILNSMI